MHNRRETHLVDVNLEVGCSCFFAELPAGKIPLRLPLNLADPKEHADQRNSLLVRAYSFQVCAGCVHLKPPDKICMSSQTRTDPPGDEDRILALEQDGSTVMRTKRRGLPHATEHYDQQPIGRLCL